MLLAKPAGGQTLDVCASCHVNATCDDKLDGSGKVCNCKYGFVGNGRAFCQDKDECQSGVSTICGPHTTCHNTYGSYYCRCLSGYSPSNNMDVFIPNDGTHCRDIDECRRISGLCGDGGLCKNLEGSFYCSCQLGYQVHNGPERFNPNTNKAFCKDVDCGSPPSTPHAHILWKKSSRVGAKVHYQCHSGYHNVGKGDVSMCTAAGSWERPPVLCQETLCGFPPVIQSTEQVWNNKSTPGSTALYFCKDGFRYQGGHNVSTCSGNGQWKRPTLSSSVCSSFPSSLKELKPPVTHLFVVDEKCVHWRAEKYEDDTEVYKVMCVGSRDYQRSFHDKRTRFLRSKSDQLEVCLKLLPVTNYSISITAVSARFTASITTNTSLTAPPAPDVYFREFETPLPTLKLRRSLNTLDPISVYQVFVLPVEGVMTFDCLSPASRHSSNEPPAEYIAAMMEVIRVGMELNFTVGDGLLYGGYFNARLENGRNYYIVLRAVSQWNEVGETSGEEESESDFKVSFFKSVFSLRLKEALASCGLK
uniref:Sushi domain containing 1 n=1 Tax=Labrus bergylta TaxID=56723 RepID=A0A3Q3E0D6_9LABR